MSSTSSAKAWITDTACVGLSVTCAVLIAACAGGSTTTLPSLPGIAPSTSADAGRPSVPAPLTFDKAKAEVDIVKPDGSACRNVSDGGLANNTGILFRVLLSVGTDAVAAKMKSDADLKVTLDKIRPELKDLSRQMIWLPEASEVLIGEELGRVSPRRPYRPATARQKQFVDTILTPIFSEMQAYATRDLKSDQHFKLELFVDDAQHSPGMLPGGTLLVPSGMVKSLATSKKNTDQLVAFMFAHEFSHALRRHVTKASQARLVDGLLTVQNFRKSFKGIPFSSDGATAFGQMFDLSKQSLDSATDAICGSGKWSLDFDQTQELEADVCGALLLDRISTPKKRYDALNGLAQYRESVASLPPVPPAVEAQSGCVAATTHPDPADRSKNLETYQRTLAKK